MLTYTDEFPTLPPARVTLAEPCLAIVVGAAALLLTLALPVATSIGRTSERAPAAASAAPTDFAPRVSHDGRYRAEVAAAPRAIRAGEPGTWVFRIARRSQRRLPGATVVLRASMPEVAGSATAPMTARYVGGSRYEVQGLRLARPGWWNLALVIGSPWRTDSLAFNVVVDR